MPIGLLAIWSGVKTFFGAVITFCSKPPGSWIALIVAILIAFWLYGNHKYNQGVDYQKNKDKAEISTLSHNVTTLRTGLDSCNTSIASAKAAGERQGREAQKAADAEKAGVEFAQAEAKRLKAIRPGANSLVTALSVGLTGASQ